MDHLNKKILNILMDVGKSTYVNIGKIIGLSAPSVAERISKMEDVDIITGYSAKLNFSKLGYKISALISLKIGSKGFQMFIEKLDDFPEIYECLKVTGEFCVVMKAAVRDNQELEDLIDRLTIYGHPNTTIILSDYSEKTFFKV